MSVPWIATIGFWGWWLVVIVTAYRVRVGPDHVLVWAAIALGAVMNTIGWVEADLGIANRAISYIVPTAEAVLLAMVVSRHGTWGKLFPWILGLVALAAFPSLLSVDQFQTEVAWQSVVRIGVGLLTVVTWVYGDRLLAVAILAFMVVPLPGLWIKELALTQHWWGTYLVGYHMEIGAKLVGVGLIGIWLWRADRHKDGV